MADFSLDSLSLGDRSQGQHHQQHLPEEHILNGTQSLSLDDDDDQINDRSSNVSTPASHQRSSLPAHLLSHSFTPRRSSPLKLAFSRDHDDDNDTDVNMLSSDNDISMADSSTDFNNDDSSLVHSPNSPKFSALFHPTALGARVATANASPRMSKLSLKTHRVEEDSLIAELDHDDDTMDTSSGSLMSDSSALNSPSVKHRAQHKPRTSSRLSTYVTNSDADTTTTTTTTSTDDDDDDDSELVSDTTSSVQGSPSVYMTPWNGNNKQPVQLQLHQHHHHYYSPQRGADSSGYQYNQGYDENAVVLPSPWSNNAEPKAPTPYLISSYLQLLFNAITSGIAIYILISTIRTVRNDINLKMEEYAAEIALEVRSCTRSYMENRCDPATRVAALEELCIGWERCMSRDPRVHAGKASVSAETLGLILNSLIEPIGSKAMLVFALGFIAWAFTSNFIFGFVRAKSYYGWNENQQHQNNQLDFQQQQQMGQLPVGGMTPSQYQLGPPQQWVDYSGSPSKR